MDNEPKSSEGQPEFTQAALFGCCPRCGERTLFAGLIRFHNKCSACGLNFSAFNVGDGPAAFLTLIIGTLIVILAVWLQLAAEPAWWVHVLLWLPLTIVSVMGGLRLTKAALMWAEYRQRAHEARNPSEDE